LSKCEQVYYDNLKHTFENTLILYEHPDLEGYFLPGNPINDTLVTSLNEFGFRNEEDVKDYLTMLEDSGRYLLEAVAFTQQQASKGYFMQDEACDETLEMLKDFTSHVEDNALIVGFNTKMDQLPFDTEAYKAQNERIIQEELIPAWEEATQRLAALKGTCEEDHLAYTSFEGGKEYYEALLKLKSSSNYALDEMWEYLLDYLELAGNQYYETVQGEEGQAMIHEYLNYAWPIMEPIAALNLHEMNMYKYVPYGSDVTYSASYMDESIANDNVLAYYVEPCIDNVKDHVIKVNPHNASEEELASLYTTMAHEGFPGHCYQYAYYYATNPHPITTCYNMMGYGEGWAMHAELYSLNWLDYSYEGTNKVMGYQDISLNYAVGALLDIAIHYKGWTPEAIAELMSVLYHQEITVEQIQAMYDYTAYRPGLIIPYGFGLAQMETMKHEAQVALGDNYSDIEFNGIILNYGPRRYETVRKDVANYIALKSE
ncbi:MAG: DUF885 family protein, partial [Erysipelotrichaceae bacterium]|nr:DUF885 family protein [Erysipelotrichaceae bacterium]